MEFDSFVLEARAIPTCENMYSVNEKLEIAMSLKNEIQKELQAKQDKLRKELEAEKLRIAQKKTAEEE